MILGAAPFGPEEWSRCLADPRNEARGGWIKFEDELALQIAANERLAARTPPFKRFLNPSPYEASIKTALDSVVDFFPEEMEHSIQENQHADLDNPPEVSVDEDLALSSQPEAHVFTDNDTHGPSSEEATKELRHMESVTVDESFYDGIFDDITYQDEALNANKTASNEAHMPLNGYDGKNPSVSVDQSAQLQPGLEKDGVTQALKRESEETSEQSPAVPKKPRFWSTYDPAKYEVSKASLPKKSQGRPKETMDKQDTPNYDPHHFEPPSSESRSSSSQKTVRGKLPNSRLNFPVVKDPHDPLTILRFSQDSSQRSHKEPGLHQPVQSSHPPGSTTSGSGDGAMPSSLSLRSSSTATAAPALDMHVTKIKQKLSSSFGFSEGSSLYIFKCCAPGTAEVMTTMHDYGRPAVVYQQAYYSEESDVPDRPREYAGREFRLESDTIHYLPPFDTSANLPAMYGEQYPTGFDRVRQEKLDKEMRESCSIRHWEFAAVPPSRSEVREWFENLKAAQESVPRKNPPKTQLQQEAMSQIEGPTQNPHGFKYSQKAKTTSVEHQTQYMSTMSIEVHVNTRGNLSANPAEDEITCVFWCIQSEDEDLDVNSHLPGVHVGMLYHGEGERPEDKVSKSLKIDTEHEPTELDLINRLVDIVRYHDPDIITGYEVHNGSWGYVIERARKKYDFDISNEVSRVKAQSHGKFGRDEDRWGSDHTSSIQITGRHMINIWRAMQSELNLLQYTMENVVFHLLHRRIPHYSHKDLTKWHKSGTPRNLHRLIEYYSSRVQMNLEIIEANELIPRTSEQARLLGIDFAAVYYRGSQFKVESLMFRIAKPENFLLVSPSRRQVGQQNALECLPLVMEPQSDFYTSPLIVLDFQSLYPSVMIAYNYCYSTFLGRAAELLKDKINIAPNGMMYAKQEVRQSLLAKMLTEILETRVMVKAGMKADKDDKILQRLLNNRQLALKLIANVTYGYTSASFSGRMPCSEIADSIVQSGRETLEKAIALIHSIDRWGAEVVYGDTDSLFVYLKGRTRDQAFDIGEEIAQAVTEMNPRPVKLKFEKVYHPCVLLAKKRYVGFKYEHRSQKEPVFDAKGIETVRRDGTPAEQKIEEKALKLLFRTADLSQVKSYFQRQCNKIMQGRVSIQDFCFAREVRLGTYSDRGTMPAGAMISTKRMLDDPRLEPQYGERVPYVVITGAPGSQAS
ncbi:hypothetical protein N7470_005114 [Penicillium chermesinum]|nr:hypothetical protein N7470_005114 [Penicillium chermesinum]